MMYLIDQMPRLINAWFTSVAAHWFWLFSFRIRYNLFSCIFFPMTEFDAFALDTLERIYLFFFSPYLNRNIYSPSIEPWIRQQPNNKIKIALFKLNKQTPNMFRSTIFLYERYTRVFLIHVYKLKTRNSPTHPYIHTRSEPDEWFAIPNESVHIACAHVYVCICVIYERNRRRDWNVKKANSYWKFIHAVWFLVQWILTVQTTRRHTHAVPLSRADFFLRIQWLLLCTRFKLLHLFVQSLIPLLIIMNKNPLKMIQNTQEIKQ